MISVSMVVAVAGNGIIGRNGRMPWRLSTDMKRFKAITFGKPVIMGRKTFRSIGRALPGRTNIVITRDASFASEGVEVFRSLEEALDFARKAAARDGQREICVIGGGEVYRQALPLADCMHLTHVECEPEGDTFFPEFNPEFWEMETEQFLPAGKRDSAATRYAIYRRKARH